jgi:uncharacterized membrane protein
MSMVFHVALILAAFLCSLVAGFLFAFAVVVMPGLKRLDDGAFIRTFQAIDRVIQNNQPLFVIMWVGSLLALVPAAVVAMWTLSGPDRLIIIVATLVYIAGVQLPTATINVPLNNTLQRLDPARMDEKARKHARESFEPRWNRSNAIRSACASLASFLLVWLIMRL